jgi:hypothetical protein
VTCCCSWSVGQEIFEPSDSLATDDLHIHRWMLLGGTDGCLFVSHNFCLHGVAWLHPVWRWTRHDDIDTTKTTRLSRQGIAQSQSNRTFASLQLRRLIITNHCAVSLCITDLSRRVVKREWLARSRKETTGIPASNRTPFQSLLGMIECYRKILPSGRVHCLS